MANVLKESSAALKSAAGSVKRMRWNRKTVLLSLGGVVAVGAVVALAVFGVPEWEVLDDARVALKPTLSDLAKNAKQNPKDPDTHLALGDALFESKNRAAGLRAYDRGLRLDPTESTGSMLDNIVSCFGTNQQSEAAAILIRHKLMGAEENLEKLTRSKHYNTRWAAIHVLEKWNKADKVDRVNVWTMDLEAPDCDVRRNAVEALGRAGTKRSIEALRSAHKRDRDNTPWFGISCLGGRTEDAEKKILARN